MRTFNQYRITMLPSLFFYFYLFPGFMFSLYLPVSLLNLGLYSTFLRHCKKTIPLLLRFVHDLTISATLLSLLTYPFAILRLIDTTELFLCKHRSLLQLLVDKECVVELLRTLLRVCTDLFVYE